MNTKILRLAMTKMYILKIIKYQLYLLQLENYELGRYFKLLFKKGLWPKGEMRKQVVWTAKAKALMLMAVGLHLLITLGLLWWADGIRPYILGVVVIWLLFYTFYFTLFTFALLLLWPFDFIAKQIIIHRAKVKIRKLSAVLDPGYPAPVLTSKKLELGFRMERGGLCVIGVAGSYGKTTMKEVLTQVTSVKYKVKSTPESVNTPVGISRWILKNVDQNTEILIVEMGEHYQGDIGQLCKITPPDMAVVTGINEAHFERMGSIQRIVDTVFEVATSLKPGGSLYLNGDNEQVVKNYQNYIWKNYEVKKYYLENITSRKFDEKNLCWYGEKNGLRFKLSLLGEYSLAFADAAMQIGMQLDMSLDEIKKGLESIQPVEHRLQPIKSSGNILVIDDTYNGNPDGVNEAIKVLARFTNRRKVFITPGLVEIGKQSVEIHRAIGKQLAGVADVVVLIRNSVTPWIEEGVFSSVIPIDPPAGGEWRNPLTSDNKQKLINEQNLRDPSTPLRSARDDRPKVVWFNTAQEAHSSLSKILKPGDVVVFQNDWGDQYL